MLFCDAPALIKNVLKVKHLDSEREKHAIPERISVNDADPQFADMFSVKELRKTWKVLKDEIPKVRARDIIDWTDWRTTLDRSLRELSDEIIKGQYVPSPPTRFEDAKSKGAYRLITAFNLRDALVFRHIANRAYENSLSRKVKGAYFSRRHSVTPIGETLTLSDFHYEHAQFFQVWLKYNQYRTRTLLNSVYTVLVVTDISNYFDSIQHDLLIEYLAPANLPRQALGLLGRLLESFKPPTGHSPNPRIGLPVDEFDCSRQLAHIFLFEHDKRVIRNFGETNYVRWMDDQSIGVQSLAEARKAVYTVNKSLASQRLTVNSGKTKFLVWEDVVRYFQLDVNIALDTWQDAYLNANPSEEARTKLHEIWHDWLNSGGTEWENSNKVLKRFYAFMMKEGSPLLEGRALTDIVRFPDLAERIFEYFARRNSAEKLIQTFTDYMDQGENLFEGIETIFFEKLLFTNPGTETITAIRQFAETFVLGKHRSQTAGSLGRSSALLALYWFGYDSAQLAELFTADTAKRAPKEVARAWLACVAARNLQLSDHVQRLLFGHHSDDVQRLAQFIFEVREGRMITPSLKNYQKKAWPFRQIYYDPRAWLLLDLFSQSPGDKQLHNVKRDYEYFVPTAHSESETSIAERVIKRIS